MQPFVALAALVGLLLSGIAAAQDRTLSLPHPLQAGETASLEVEVGPLPAGTSITVTTAAGEPLGRLSPFGPRAAQAGGSYVVPVPAAAMRDGRLTVRLLVSVPGAPPRAPTALEVTGVKLTSP